MYFKRISFGSMILKLLENVFTDKPYSKVKQVLFYVKLFDLYNKQISWFSQLVRKKTII